MLRAAVLAPAVVALAGAPVQAGTDAVSRARSGAEQAVATIGHGSVLATARKALPGARGMVFSGITATCRTSADGGVAGSTTINRGELVGGALGGLLPANPPANFRVFTGNPDFVVTLNKQIRDPAGGMTVSAVSVDETVDETKGALPTRDLGVARCSPLTRGHTGGLTGPVGSAGVIGSAPALGSAANLPADPAAAKDALPAGIGDTQMPAVPRPALSGQELGGLPGLPVGPGKLG